MKNKIGWTIIVSSTLLIILSFYILACGYVEYSFVLFLFSVIMFIIGIIFIKKAGNTSDNYYKELDEILNKYKTILKKTKNLPTADNKVSINFKNMEDLVDIQEKNNNPIFYKKENDKCTFMISDEQETFIYIKRLNEEENNIKNEVDKKEEIPSKKKNSKEEKDNKKEENKNKKDNKSKKYEIEILD